MLFSWTIYAVLVYSRLTPFSFNDFSASFLAQVTTLHDVGFLALIKASLSLLVDVFT